MKFIQIHIEYDIQSYRGWHSNTGSILAPLELRGSHELPAIVDAFMTERAGADYDKTGLGYIPKSSVIVKTEIVNGPDDVFLDVKAKP